MHPLIPEEEIGDEGLRRPMTRPPIRRKSSFFAKSNETLPPWWAGRTSIPRFR